MGNKHQKLSNRKSGRNGFVEMAVKPIVYAIELGSIKKRGE